LLGLAADARLLDPTLALAAAGAYREYRRLQHQVRLTGAAHARVESDAQAARRASVDALWNAVFGARRGFLPSGSEP
jgi:glutamate-ammonia-ligase adenylyltransferase